MVHTSVLLLNFYLYIKIKVLVLVQWTPMNTVPTLLFTDTMLASESPGMW